MTPSDVLKLIKDKNIKFVDLRFTDTLGKEQHVTLPADQADAKLFEDGKMFDGSSIAGWKAINESDMILMLDPSSTVKDIFSKESQINIRCDVIEPATMKGYGRDPRSVAKRGQAYLKSTGIADSAMFGPENEFFIFDGVKYDVGVGHATHVIKSSEAAWSTGDDFHSGHVPGIKGGYFPVPPVDALHDIRQDMCLALAEMGLVAEVHHHEVATAGQCEIGIGPGDCVTKGDQVQILKYVVQNVAHKYGKTATFMPKPLVGDNGSGMHVHQSLSKNGTNIFSGNVYADHLSQDALYYIGGIIKHAKALNAFTNASTNSYRRLIPGFEAPTKLVYSARNRSASIRVPWIKNPKARRIEVRFPDSTANPYFAFTAMMMAGLDGIKNKIDPGKSHDMDLYELTPAEDKEIPTVCHSLDMALEELDKDREFLRQGDVITDDLIDAYIDLKSKEVTAIRQATHPIEFKMYYSL